MFSMLDICTPYQSLHNTSKEQHRLVRCKVECMAMLKMDGHRMHLKNSNNINHDVKKWELSVDASCGESV